MIKYSAPAKVHMSGEHSVVYGKPALLTAINYRLICTLIEKSQHPVRDGQIVKIDSIVRKHLKIHNRSIDYNIKITSDIPRGKGLGSSAAFSCALVSAIYEHYSKREASQETISNLAYTAEKLFHANASGGDTTTSCMGGLVFFRKEFEFLKGIYTLNFKIPRVIEQRLYLIDTGKPVEKTSDMVNYIGKAYNKNPKKYERIMNEIEKTTKRMVISIVKKDAEFFSQQLRQNQSLLTDLGVVSEKAQKLLNDISVFAVGKITGAGGIKSGAGFALCFVNDERGFAQYCEKHSISIIKFNQSHEGVKKL
ncbi:hypothetical protein A2957_01240 [Candidatus Roizmanbacteria bacterium RIFCSPLOWO2_01_FULL_38_11]|uniref:mevalonate kinase n=1 Tax=Candidatus Roizmanbacteria bacterium RIFCSPLOWO2_01_FULL_38_11 TaxID=1802060 RepID=A0A1F7IL28_9BACT|nr:MAG: hypothetical protein A2957_01240 [Candidatus Roizmanbacteria bacterium RIFCSPLOWO2_01_FULL_38_11]